MYKRQGDFIRIITRASNSAVVANDDSGYINENATLNVGDDDSANDMKIDRDGDMSELREQEDEEEIDEEQAGGNDEEGQKMEIAEVGDENDTNTPVVNNLDSAVITAVATENEDKKEKAPKKSSTIVPPENQLAVNRSRRVIEPLSLIHI